MIAPTIVRPGAAIALVVGLFLALPGCGGNTPAPTGDDKKGDPKADPTPKKGPDPTPKTPDKVIDLDSGVEKEANAFLTAVTGGMGKADQLTEELIAFVGLPKENKDVNAELWLNEVGRVIQERGGVGAAFPSKQVGDVAFIRGALVGDGGYFLRMQKVNGQWKIGWLSATSLAKVNSPPPADSPDAVAQQFAVTAVMATICDQDAMHEKNRAFVVASGLTPALRAAWTTGELFQSEKDEGYDFRITDLEAKIKELGNGATAVTIAPAGDATFQVEVAKSGGAKVTYTVKVVKGTAPGQWLVDSITAAG